MPPPQAYTDKLRELRRTCKSLFKRVDEAEKRPKLVTAIKDGLKLAKDFAVKAKNLTADMNIFTDVELSTLATLVEETEVCYEKCEVLLKAALFSPSNGLRRSWLSRRSYRLTRTLSCIALTSKTIASGWNER